MEKKLTKTNRFEDLRAVLVGDTAPNGSTVDELLQFIDHETELLTKKNKTPDKPTEKQKENEEFKTQILEFLTEEGEARTCSEIQQGVEALKVFSNQKIAALVRQLVNEGKVTKEIVGRKAVFSIC